MIPSRICIALLSLAVAATLAAPEIAHAQAPAPIKITMTVAEHSETVGGTGLCGHEPKGWIYGKPAALWTAEFTGEKGAASVRLTYWRLAGAGDQFYFSVRGPKANHQINTVKGGALVGSGRSSFHATKTGGRFEITGKAGDGADVSATIECSRFGSISAEGG